MMAADRSTTHEPIVITTFIYAGVMKHTEPLRGFIKLTQLRVNPPVAPTLWVRGM